MNPLKILYQDDWMVAIDKPPGMFVHPTEDPRNYSPIEKTCLGIVKNQIGKYLYPVHRIDRPTSGVVVFALSSEAARFLAEQFQNNTIKKKYVAVVRGYSPKTGVIDSSLKNLDNGNEQDSKTSFETLAQIELPYPTQEKFTSSRYSLITAEPHSGRQHQIRRHLRRLNHPLIGDRTYGDPKSNLVFEEKLQIHGLMLKAYGLRLIHPENKNATWIHANWNHTWHQVFDLFNFCPYISSTDS